MRLLIVSLWFSFTPVLAFDSLESVCADYKVKTDVCLSLVQDYFNLQYKPNEDVSLEELNLTYDEVSMALADHADKTSLIQSEESIP